MPTYAVLLRGINVGGKNRVPMSGLKRCLEDLGYSGVTTYIASGNVILRSGTRAEETRKRIESALPEAFELDDDLVKALVLTRKQLRAVVEHKPRGFGEQPGRYHSDAIFLLGVDSARVVSAFHPREGVDRIWPGDGVIYAQRLSAQRTRSRLGKIVGTPVYKSMTIRSWSTTTRLLELLEEVDAREGA